MFEPSPDKSSVDAFLDLYSKDRNAGAVRSIREYLDLFPDAEEAIALEWATLRSRDMNVTAPETAGDALGPYRLEEEIGRGGQGVVYRATDTRIDRTVALKVLRGLGPGSEKVLAYFMREASIASKLDHPGLCPVYDAEIAGGIPYIAMRYVDGETLAQRITSTREGTVGDNDSLMVIFDEVDRDDARTTKIEDTSEKMSSGPTERPILIKTLRLIENTARALHAAHEAGVIHRDVKPGNVMVTAEGEAIVMDFGLARDDHNLDLQTLTQSGDLFGTPAYMSPEQLTRHALRLDRRTDVWSLGVMLYECVTLARPFEAATRENLYQNILMKDPTDPRSLNPHLPRDLVTVIMTALEKDRDRRYQTALEFAEELRRIREYEPIKSRPVSPLTRLVRWGQRNPALATMTTAAAMILIAGATAATLLAIRADANATQAEANAEEASKNARAANANLAEWERLADGRRLDDLVKQANGPLWPALPKTIPAYRSWLDKTRALTAKIPEHEAALKALRARGTYDAADDRGRKEAADAWLPGTPTVRASWTFTDEGDQLRHDKLRDLVAGLRGLLAEPSPNTVSVAGIERRLADATALQRRLKDDDAAAWRRCIKDLATADAQYTAPVAVTPIPGLVPLGRDRDSKLWEFWHIASGARPEWETHEGSAFGKAKLHEDSGAEGVIMVLIPGGVFRMGAVKPAANQPEGSPNVDAQVYSGEGPVHAVRLDAYLIAKYELTQGQWVRLFEENPSYHRAGETEDGESFTLRMPVTGVDWEQCREACRRWDLGLPTEAQWERACRAGTTTRFYTGDELASLRGHANLGDAARFRRYSSTLETDFDDGYVNLSPVGGLLPNPFGLHNVHGNVFEWCLDGYHRYDEHAPRSGDGLRGPLLGARLRVLRGGCYSNPARYARSTSRHNTTPDHRNNALGVRPSRKITE